MYIYIYIYPIIHTVHIYTYTYIKHVYAYIRTYLAAPRRSPGAAADPITIMITIVMIIIISLIVTPGGGYFRGGFGVGARRIEV